MRCPKCYKQLNTGLYCNNCNETHRPPSDTTAKTPKEKITYAGEPNAMEKLANHEDKMSNPNTVEGLSPEEKIEEHGWELENEMPFE